MVLILRLPISGERHKRRFLKTDKVEYLYTYIDYLNSKGDCSFELESQSNVGTKDQNQKFNYQIVQSFGPKRIIYEDK